MTTKGRQEIFYLTDDIISMYSEDNILTEYRDFNLKYQSWEKPYKKGVYDEQIFGSIYRDRCNCGMIRVQGRRCPKCGSTVLDETAASKRYARIELPVYYCNELRFAQLLQFIERVFNVKLKLRSNKFGTMNKLNNKVMDICQMEYDEKTNTLLVTDEITDSSKCSYEGLIEIFNIHKHELLPIFKSYINSYILVMPLTVRAPVVTRFNGDREIHHDQLTTDYINIIYLTQVYYPKVFTNLKTPIARALFNGSLRLLVNKTLSNISSLLLPSKINYARTMQGSRVPDSLRATIVPSPDLKIDEVGVPRHLMYETCREEFIQYLMKELDVTQHEADNIWRTESNTDKVQNLFTRYIEGNGEDDKGKYVIINRAPTLYELGMACCKVKLTNDYAMRLPIALCEPFNADFDGDAMTAYAVPKKMTDEIVEMMSPRNLIYYKKNHKPLYLPKHEILKGIVLASRTIMPDKLQTFYSLEEANAYRKKHRDFKYQTVFMLDGEMTTLGRERLSEYFGTNINNYLQGLDKSLDAKSIVPLYVKLETMDDRPERIQKVQEFASQISTISGTTTLTLDEMYMSFGNEKLKQIKETQNNNILTAEEKEIKIRDLYDQYVVEMSEKVDDNVKLIISDSSRAKLNQLLDMTLVRLNVNTDKSYNVSESTIASGMTPEDYVNLAIENRATQDIKTSATPDSGYTTRQFVFAASNYYYHDGYDEKNPGILIKMKDAVGRTEVNGNIITDNKSDDLVRVRSIVTSKQPSKYVVTKDMLCNIFHYKDKSRIGISIISSFTEQITQAGLALKHGGNLFNMDTLNKIIAPEDGTVQTTGMFILFTGKSGKIYKYPKSEEFVLNFSSDGTYKKGSLIGRTYHLFTPSYRLSCITELCKAKPARSPKSFMRNKVLISDCYCIKEGTIHYTINKVTNQINVFIGDEYYEYNPNACYFYPEGTKIKKYQRFCTGLMDLQLMVDKLNNYEEVFYHFRNQMNELIDVAPEMIEFVFTVIVKMKQGKITVNSVLQNIQNSNSFYTALSFGYARKIFKKINVTGTQFNEDTFTRVMLPILSMDKFIS